MAAWAVPTMIWLIASTRSPAAYRPSTVVCWWVSTFSAPASPHSAPSVRGQLAAVGATQHGVEAVEALHAAAGQLDPGLAVDGVDIGDRFRDQLDSHVIQLSFLLRFDQLAALGNEQRERARKGAQEQCVRNAMRCFGEDRDVAVAHIEAIADGAPAHRAGERGRAQISEAGIEINEPGRKVDFGGSDGVIAAARDESFGNALDTFDAGGDDACTVGRSLPAQSFRLPKSITSLARGS